MPVEEENNQPIRKLLDPAPHEYSIEQFNEKTDELMRILKPLGFMLQEQPYNVAGQWITYRIGVARKEGSPVMISWRLQDDGNWNEAYLTVDIERFDQFHPNEGKRFGGPSIALGVTRLYPNDFELIAFVVNQLENFNLSNLQV